MDTNLADQAICADLHIFHNHSVKAQFHVFTYPGACVDMLIHYTSSVYDHFFLDKEIGKQKIDPLMGKEYAQCRI
jgi:hypothetical protein